MHPNPIYRSLTRPVRWMGMERLPGAFWVLGTAMLTVTGLMYAGAWLLTAAVVALGGAGVVGLTRIAEFDAAFFRVILRRMRYRDVYPARVPRIPSSGWSR